MNVYKGGSSFSDVRASLQREQTGEPIPLPISVWYVGMSTVSCVNLASNCRQKADMASVSQGA